MPDRAAGHHGFAPKIREALSDPSLGFVRFEVAANTPLHEPGEAVRDLFLIEAGQVRVFQVGPDGSNRLASILGPGDFFDVTNFSESAVYSTRAIAVVTTVLHRVSLATIVRRIDLLPPMESSLILYLAQALKQAQDESARLVFDDCSARLTKTLLQFSSTAAASPTDTGVVLRITHEQLAQAVGAARETVSLALTQLRRKNLLKTGRNRLFFNPEALKEFAERPSTPAPEAATDR